MRQLKIEESFKQTEFIDSETLCKKFQASESTIRRDLSELEKKGLIRRVHGGALSLHLQDDHMDFAYRSAQSSQEKRRIGQAAATLVKEGTTIILDGGSTVAEVARHLNGRTLQVITNSIPIAEIFHDSQTVDVSLTGGYLYPRSGVLMGHFCEQILSMIKANTVIMGIGGISENGLSNSNSLIVGQEKKMIEVSNRVIIVADHTKFGHDSTIFLAPLERANVVVTDTLVDPKYVTLLKSRGVNVLVV